MSHESDRFHDSYQTTDPQGVDYSGGPTMTSEARAGEWGTQLDASTQAPVMDAPTMDSPAIPQAPQSAPYGNATGTSGDTGTRWRDQVILDAVRSIIRHKILCLLVIGIAGFVGAGATMFMQPFYVAKAKIYPPMNDNPLGGFGIAGMAGLLGNLGVNTTGSSQFPLYEQALFGRDLLVKLLQSPMPAAGADATVLDYLSIQEPDATIREAIGIGILREKLFYEADTKTAVVSIAAKDSDPKAAAFLVNRSVELLNEFDIKTSTEHASEKRRFIEGRLLESSRVLGEAEAKLEQFHAQNMRINAPHLVLQEARLRRELEIEQQVYLTLRKEAELASIEEHRSVPVVNVLERATPPLGPAGPSWFRNGVLAGFLATMLTMGFFALRAAQPATLLARIGLIQPRA